MSNGRGPILPKSKSTNIGLIKKEFRATKGQEESKKQPQQKIAFCPSFERRLVKLSKIVKILFLVGFYLISLFIYRLLIFPLVYLWSNKYNLMLS